MAGAKYVICATPMVKVYLPEWHERLIEEPDLIYDKKTKFSFDVPRGSSAFKIEFNKPMLVKGNDDKEIITLYNWLIGESGQSHLETDCYGIVAFDPGIDLVDTSDQMATLEALASGDLEAALEAKKKLDILQKDTAKRITTLRERVEIESEKRIRVAMKTVHNNLIRQWQINSEQNMGKYPPSIAEALGAHALDAELKAKERRGEKLFGRMNDMMANIKV